MKPPPPFLFLSFPLFLQQHFLQIQMEMTNISSKMATAIVMIAHTGTVEEKMSHSQIWSVKLLKIGQWFTLPLLSYHEWCHGHAEIDQLGL